MMSIVDEGLNTLTQIMSQQTDCVFHTTSMSLLTSVQPSHRGLMPWSCFALHLIAVKVIKMFAFTSV